MYSAFVTIHSILFLVVLALGILSIYKGLTGKVFTESDRKVGLFYMISLHTQLLIGLVLYLALSPVTTAAFADFGAAMKDPATRLILVEHVTVNIIAIVLYCRLNGFVHLTIIYVRSVYVCLYVCPSTPPTVMNRSS